MPTTFSRPARGHCRRTRWSCFQDRWCRTRPAGTASLSASTAALKNSIISPTLAYEDYSVRWAGTWPARRYEGYPISAVTGFKLTPVTAASLECCVMPREALLKAGGFAGGYLGSREKGLDLGLRLSRGGVASYWLPSVQMLGSDETSSTGTSAMAALVESIDRKILDARGTAELAGNEKPIGGAAYMTEQLRVLVVSHGHPALALGGAEIASHSLHQGLNSLPDVESVYLARVGQPVPRHGASALMSLRPTEDELLFHADDYNHFFLSNGDTAGDPARPGALRSRPPAPCRPLPSCSGPRDGSALCGARGPAAVGHPA